MRRSCWSALLLLGLLVGSCTDVGDELADEMEPAQAAEAGRLPDESWLDGAADAPAVGRDAAGAPLDAGAELDASELVPDALDASDLQPDAAGLDGGLADAATDGATTKLDGGASDAGSPDAGTDAGPDAGLDGGKDGGSAPSDAALPDASVDAEVKLDAAVDNGPNTFGRVYNIFRSSCRNCHQEGAEYSLNLGTRELAYAELVGGPNKGAAEFIVCANQGLFRVIPYDPSRSMLLQKLENKQTCGDRMPPNGSLSAAQIQEVRNWIALGALDN